MKNPFLEQSSLVQKLKGREAVLFPTDTVPALLTPGEVVIPKELAGRFTQSKVNLLEIDLPTIKKEPTSNQVNPPLPETTEVEYISSINPFNSYMTTTPELHGICA